MSKFVKNAAMPRTMARPAPRAERNAEYGCVRKKARESAPASQTEPDNLKASSDRGRSQPTGDREFNFGINSRIAHPTDRHWSQLGWHKSGCTRLLRTSPLMANCWQISNSPWTSGSDERKGHRLLGSRGTALPRLRRSFGKRESRGGRICGRRQARGSLDHQNARRVHVVLCERTQRHGL
jgi:hypothetical protein